MPRVAIQKPRNPDQHRGLYRHEYLLELMKESGHTPRTIAKKANISKTTVGEALLGDCKKIETLWAITVVLGGKWESLFEVDLPEFHRAVVRTGNSGTAR